MRDLAAFRSAAPSAGVPARQIVEKLLTKFGLGDRVHAIETNSWEAILDAVATTDMFSLAPRDEAMRHGWTSRLVAIGIPEIVIHPRNGIVTRAGRLPVAARRAGDRARRTRLCRARARQVGARRAASPPVVRALTRRRSRASGA